MYQNKLHITNEAPTTIVEDFHAFINYLSSHPIKLTKTKQELSRKDLRALYGLLPKLGLEVGERSTQIYYPVINLFMELAFTLELIRKASKGSSIVIEVDEAQLQALEKLTMTEQYVSLLQCFWLHADWEALQGALYAQKPINVDALFEYLKKLPVNQKISLQSDESLQYFVVMYGHFLLYFQYFGFWNVTLDKQLEPKTKVKAVAIEIKPFLKPLIPTFQKSFESRENLFDGGFLSMFNNIFCMEQLDELEEEDLEEELMTTAEFVAELKPLFEEGQLENVLQAKEKVIKHGEYIFKVALSGSCWRTIALHDSQTLLDLHTWIQRAFSFMDDHLYAFYMDGQPYSRNCYNAPYDNAGPYVDAVTIAELYLEEGQQFLYLFDFGDEWLFQVTVEKIYEGVDDCVPGIRKEKGKAPTQYEDWGF